MKFKTINNVIFLPFLLLFTTSVVSAQTKPATKQWYESLQLRGYMQVRYNRILETNPLLKCDQCDKSWGDNGGGLYKKSEVDF